jgi:hypothetical protein
MRPYLIFAAAGLSLFMSSVDGTATCCLMTPISG